MMKVSGGNLHHCSGISEAIATAVLPGTKKSKVFTELDSHMFDTPVSGNVAKSGHKFCWYRISIQVIYFQINGDYRPEAKRRRKQCPR